MGRTFILILLIAGITPSFGQDLIRQGSRIELGGLHPAGYKEQNRTEDRIEGY